MLNLQIGGTTVRCEYLLVVKSRKLSVRKRRTKAELTQRAHCTNLKFHKIIKIQWHNKFDESNSAISYIFNLILVTFHINEKLTFDQVVGQTSPIRDFAQNLSDSTTEIGRFKVNYV